MLRVHDLSIPEGQSLQRLLRRTRDVTVLKRVEIVLYSNQGFSPPKIARMVGWSLGWVRDVIKNYNQRGRDALFPNRGGGRPPKFTKRVRRDLVNLALARPRDHGFPIQTWSLDRLCEAAVMEGIVASISRERLRQILIDESVSFQAVKTWKQSNDPQFEQKKRRIERLTNREHNPPIVVSADEMGPISLRPHGGRMWAGKNRPHRVRATYSKNEGVRYLMGMHDFFHDRMHGWITRRKRGTDWARHLRYVRSKYPGRERIYLIQDNLSAHTTPECVAEARRLNIVFVPIPTNASFLNPIECRFGNVKRLALTGSDYPDWRALARALQDAMRYRNRAAVAEPKARRRLWRRH